MIKSFVAVAAAVSIAAALSGCSSPVRTFRTYEYQCCSAADVETIYSPGQIVALHWAPHRVTTESLRMPSAPTMSVKLYGPYASVNSIKGSATTPTGKPLAIAKVLHPSVTVAQTRLSSELLIPADAAPGYYSVVTTTISSSGNSAEGATIIQVK
jgi:hypothetical protein